MGGGRRGGKAGLICGADGDTDGLRLKEGDRFRVELIRSTALAGLVQQNTPFIAGSRDALSGTAGRSATSSAMSNTFMAITSWRAPSSEISE